ncbi:MAG: aminopeptidase [Bacteroidales bacterium]|nr:aminopeptidase [Bacteroidales bacterium]MCF8345074.1 aminopeptidase [Bacteroidales bacterium]MCF8350987.1 aminopeptidase [Bacteroidales bacterium]MCF8376111.1 aminopeptidase [Bacteroidales bacterium]MCF8401424.1 aminopeptidase [Bacteroidales bacterium]
MQKGILLMMAALMLGMISPAAAQEKEEEKNAYEFTEIKVIPHTAVKNQYRSGTCWSFSGLGMFEAELIRMGKGEYDLSEIFIVRNAYSDKAKKYVRLHGNLNMAGGGGFSDDVYVLKTYGLVPEEVYSGKVIGEEDHVHGEMDAVFKAYTDAVIKNKNKKLTPVWHDGFKSLLDTYLGEYPYTFEYEGEQYNPAGFADDLELNPDDYVEITSYTHQPFYKPFIMQIPDNWMWSKTYNVPLDEMMEIVDYALDNGYTIAWGADVSDKGFSWKNGVAIIPDVEIEDLSGTEKERWEDLTPGERKKAMYSFEEIVPEKTITQEMRQESYNNYETTDDHGMLIVGKAKDQKGNIYYKVKNSWGTEGHIYDGYIYVSKPYIAYKTMNYMLHKNAIPENIREKLNL